MYCDNCGAEVQDKKKFCDNCGATVRWAYASDYIEVENKMNDTKSKNPYQPTRPALARKILLFPFVFFLFPGLGHIYAGKLFRGVGYFVGAFILGTASMVTYYENLMSLTIILWAVVGALIIWITIDAVILLKKYNNFIDENLRLPKHLEKYEKKQPRK